MLKTLDILIGVAVVMLLMSMIVTVVTQFVLAIFNSRGRHLLTGVTDLLEQLHPGMSRTVAEAIAGKVLTHPLVRTASGGYGTVIHREELTKLLLEMAADEGPQKLEGEAKQALHDALAENGLCQQGNLSEKQQQIAGVLQNVRSLALQLELTHPELTNAARMRVAMLQQANSQFLAKINGWFDQTMDRVSERFTSRTRMVTFGVGLLIALIVQLDTAALVSRLSTDQALRDSLVSRALEMDKTGQGEPPADQKLALTEADRVAVRDLMMNNVLGIPQSFGDWVGRWSRSNFVMKLLGILLTAVLLSLGAPFWYNALQNLVRFRSVLASKDDQQRRERQLSVPTATATATAAAAGAGPDATVLLADERGDLAVTA